jgi:isocitrate dehydrogenase kinase/phosphatase
MGRRTRSISACFEHEEDDNTYGIRKSAKKTGIFDFLTYFQSKKENYIPGLRGLVFDPWVIVMDFECDKI